MVSMIVSVCFLIAFAAHGLKLDGTTRAQVGGVGEDNRPLSRKQQYIADKKKAKHSQEFKPTPTPGTTPGPYSRLPNFTLMARVYSAAEDELNNFLLPSYNIFWPRNLWPSSRLKLMWDNESTWDHAAAWRTLKRWKFLTNAYEDTPANGTLCDAMRTTGYARQQYSNFIVDETLEDLRDDEYVGFVDSDTFFTTAVLPEELFDWDSAQRKWKPRVFGYNSCCVDWMKTTKKIIAPGQTAGNFMTVYGFPIILKVDHLKAIRRTMTSKGDFASPSWDETFRKICGTGSYSQFDIMMNVLWNSELHDEYSWYLRSQSDAQSPSFHRGVANSREYALSKNDFHHPKLSMMEHATHRKTTTKNVSQYICTYDHLNPLDPIVRDTCSELSVDQMAAMRKDRFVDEMASSGGTGRKRGGLWIRWRAARKFGLGEKAPSDEAMSRSMQEHMDRVYLHKEAFPWLQ